MTDDAEKMAQSVVINRGHRIEYFSQDIVKCENCHRSLEVNYDGEWDGSWHDLTTIRPLKSLEFGAYRRERIYEH